MARLPSARDPHRKRNFFVCQEKMMKLTTRLKADDTTGMSLFILVAELNVTRNMIHFVQKIKLLKSPELGTHTWKTVKHLEIKYKTWRSAVKRRRDALNAPQQMIFRFLLFSQPKNGPPSYNFPPSLSRHVTPSEGGNHHHQKGNGDRAMIGWSNRRFKYPPPTLLFYHPLPSIFFFLYPVEGFFLKSRKF